MAQFEKGNKIGNRFSSDNQPKKNGRKPSLYKKLKKQTGIRVDHELSKEDYYNVIRFLMERTPNELNSLLKDTDGHANKNTPIWILNIVSAINSDIRYGRTTTIDGIFDRLFGKATQAIEADISTPQKTDEMTDEQIRAEIDRIDNELKK